MTTCACGCGDHVKRRYVSGHNSRGVPKSSEHRQKIAAANTGWRHSEETKAKIRTAALGRKHTEQSRALMSASRTGLRFTAERRLRVSERQRGEMNPGWKGDDVGYGGIHAWVRSRKRLTGTCSVCGSKPDRIARSNGRDLPGTEWANLSGEYARDLDDYAEMCVPCHRRHDRKGAGGS